jgi:hypothetical protein
MVKAWENEGIEVFWVFWAWNEAAREDMLLLIAFVWGKVQDHPDVNPAVRALVPVQLCTVNRKQEDSVARLNLIIRNCCEVVASTDEIIVNQDRPLALV